MDSSLTAKRESGTFSILKNMCIFSCLAVLVVACSPDSSDAPAPDEKKEEKKQPLSEVQKEEAAAVFVPVLQADLLVNQLLYDGQIRYIVQEAPVIQDAHVLVQDECDVTNKRIDSVRQKTRLTAKNTGIQYVGNLRVVPEPDDASDGDPADKCPADIIFESQVSEDYGLNRGFGNYYSDTTVDFKGLSALKRSHNFAKEYVLSGTAAAVITTGIGGQLERSVEEDYSGFAVISGGQRVKIEHSVRRTGIVQRNIGRGGRACRGQIVCEVTDSQTIVWKLTSKGQVVELEFKLTAQGGRQGSQIFLNKQELTLHDFDLMFRKFTSGQTSAAKRAKGLDAKDDAKPTQNDEEGGKKEGASEE